MLYGATFSIDGVKKGNNHIISFRLEFANERFIQDEAKIMDEALQLLKDIIFDPHTEGQSFPESVVEREKATLKNKITSIYDNKIAYANMRLIDEMCDEELFQIHTNGYEADLPAINAKDLYSYYQTMLKEDQMDIYILGDFDEELVSKKLRSTFKRSSFNGQEITEEPTKKITESKEVIETQPIQQAKLHIGYRTNCTYQDQQYFALHVR